VLAFDLAERIGFKSTQFGFLLGAAAIGLVFGAGILGHWGDRFHHKPLPLIGFLSMAFVLAIFTFTKYKWLGLGLSGFLGLGSLIDWRTDANRHSYFYTGINARQSFRISK
jgi:MFS family permease